jgi:hypothetical protein
MFLSTIRWTSEALAWRSWEGGTFMLNDANFVVLGAPVPVSGVITHSGELASI